MGKEKWTDADRKRHEDNEAILALLRGVKQELDALKKEKEQLKQNAQQGSEQLSNGDLAFIISIANLNQQLMGYKILQGCLKSRITQKAVYFARVALSRVYNEVETENRARTIAYAVVKSSFADDVAEELFAEWNKELENKTVIEIIQIIRQTILKVPTLQDQNPGPQR